MYLKTLTVRGFKSFASATTFEFEPGVTAVVGPNGSGKSNVVDALAWVMGEQGAKTLRGGKMEDVIFAGTTGRAALGRAQVSLTIDNTDGALPIEYSEVTISRTLFRSGGSEYAINGSPCRLLDIQELLSDSGLGREMHVIVGQGQLDRILRATPEERRGFIEEAAGILKHRRRKEKTLRKLDAMQANLARLEDLTKEIGRQLKPLGKQAATARRARTIQATVRDARARLLADDVVALTESARQAEAAQEELRRAREAAQGEADRAAATLARLESAATAAAPTTVAARTTWYELSRLQERYRSLATLAQERQRLLGSPDAQPHRGDDPDRLDQRAEEAATETTEAESAVAAADAALHAAGEDRATAEAAQRAEDERLTRILRAVADRREGLARLAGQVGTARQRVESAEGERARSAETGEAARRRHESAMAALSQAEVTAEETGTAAAAPLAEVARLKEAMNSARAAVRSARSALGPLSERRAALAARVQTLGESLPTDDGAEDLLSGMQDRIVGVLGERLRVRQGSETAVQAALAGAESALVARDAELALDVATVAADGTHGSLRLLARAPASGGLRLPADVPSVLDVVEAEPEELPLVTALLAGIALAEDDRQARGWASDHGIVAVTPEGHRWEPTGVSIGSGTAAALLSRRTRLEAAQRDLAEAEAQEADAARTLAEAEPHADQVETQLREAEAAARRCSEASRAASAEVERLRSLAQQAQQEADRMVRAEREAAAAVVQATAQLQDLAARLETAQAVPEESEPSTAERDRLAQVAVDARATEVDARLALRTAQETARRLQERVRSLRRAAQTERRARAEAVRRTRRRAAQARRAARVEQLVGAATERLDASTDAAERAVREAEETERRLAAEIEAARSSQARAAAEVTRLAEASHADELAEAERRARLENLSERSIDELGMTPDYLVEHFGPHLPVPVEDTEQDKWAALRTEVDEDGNPIGGAPFERAEQERRLKRAERDLGALGKVNPLALEEFAALEERHTYLTGQLEDLRRSRQDLMDLVREVDEHVRVVFAEAYEDTAREFVRIFDRLFPGGDGRLTLTDPEDMLTTGIEVEARPAGKKVKRLSLLSGGERSLTAIALLVAIFTARPSPFYVMDEVEAALDERNLLRLLSVFSDLREHSQLIIITHQKLTMDIADALYGVSMRGDGVTKVISQRMEREEA